MQEAKTIAKTLEQEPVVKTSVRLPKSIHKELKQFCLDNETTEVQAITEAVTEYIRSRRKR
jgi:hypothetical protein